MSNPSTNRDFTGQIDYIDIYPPINVARVGDADPGEDNFFLGSEVPGVEFAPGHTFRDAKHKIKKQAARFRVYAFDKDSKPLGEITSDDYTLTWEVHVANKKGAWIQFHGKYDLPRKALRNQKRDEQLPHELDKLYEYTNSRSKYIIDSKAPPIVVAKDTPAISVPLVGKFQGSLETREVQLGELRTDKQGRLLFLPSDGHSHPVGNSKEVRGFNNDDWVDTMCDGWVRVTVKDKSGSEHKSRNKATIITAPPRFASGTHAPTTLYELIENIYEQPRRKEGRKVAKPDYYRDIYPLFHRIYLLSWTNPLALNHGKPKGHGAEHMKKYFEDPDLSDPNPDNNEARYDLLNWIRMPLIDGVENEQEKADRDKNRGILTKMPRLFGDQPNTPGPHQWASLTELQYEQLIEWANGNFTNDEPKTPYTSFDQIPLEEQPDALTRSALEWSIGAALYPGIEVDWHSELPGWYKFGDPKRDRFRHADKVEPGDLGKGLCLPWQSDYYMCQGQWWPSTRPDAVVTQENFELQRKEYFKTNEAAPEGFAYSVTGRVLWDHGIADPTDMVEKWSELGFVSRQPYEREPPNCTVYTEKERNLPRAAAFRPGVNPKTG